MDVASVDCLIKNLTRLLLDLGAINPLATQLTCKILSRFLPDFWRKKLNIWDEKAEGMLVFEISDGLRVRQKAYFREGKCQEL